MKGLATKFAVLIAATLISALPVLAQSGSTGMGMDPGEKIQKDECLLASLNCRDSVDSIQQRIDRLNREIRKGTSVYSRDELRKLDFQLRDATEMLADLTHGGA
ncbi:MAG: hypothetical protein A2075_19605 [Geobacteraceae bacterium GWC2_58_44]|nr:MAG: hypothetical protein A2075_19605 [Geobacteraceae bacterium GWC2_58_44]HBG06956.1 hypothetical protein [Geobacter sp.]